jgi:DNA-binding MurR/RpiR family transcriptional regulator
VFFATLHSDATNCRVTLKNTIPFLRRIEQSYETLSPNARKVADYLQQNPLDVLNTSLADIAEISKTSKATVSRFFRQLGYESQLDLKKELRSLRASGYPLATNSSTNDHVQQELMRIQQTWDNVDPEDVNLLIDKIIAAPRVTLIGFRNSFPVALHFRQQLLQVRDTVRIMPQPGQTISEEIEDIAKDELIIIVAFRRRPRVIQNLISLLEGRKLVLFADPSAQIYKGKVSQLIVCQLGQELPLDSYAAPMSLISVVCNGVLAKTMKASKARITSISERYRLLDELE